MTIGASEAETFWTEFLRALTRRGLRGVKLVISDAHEGLKAAAARVLNATWQRCRVHFTRNLLAHAGKSGRRVVAAFVATAFAQEDAQTAKTQWRQVADQLRPKAPKLANLMDQAEPDVLAYMTFPKEHRTKLHSTNPIERLNGEIKRRTNVVGIFPNEAAITRLIGAILLEQNDDWAVQRARYMTLESITPSGHDDLIRLPQPAGRITAGWRDPARTGVRSGRVRTVAPGTAGRHRSEQVRSASAGIGGKKPPRHQPIRQGTRSLRAHVRRANRAHQGRYPGGSAGLPGLVLRRCGGYRRVPENAYPASRKYCDHRFRASGFGSGCDSGERPNCWTSRRSRKPRHRFRTRAKSFELSFRRGAVPSRQRLKLLLPPSKLRQVEVLVGQGTARVDAIREVRITEQTYYRWRKKYGGMGPDQLRELKRLQRENERLRRAVSDLTLEKLIRGRAF